MYLSIRGMPAMGMNALKKGGAITPLCCKIGIPSAGRVEGKRARGHASGSENSFSSDGMNTKYHRRLIS
jgi:hypothetical protein